MVASDSVSAFRTWILENGRTVTPDGRVDSATAADLLGVSEGHLRNLRSACGGPSFFKAGGRVTYRLDDLATWLEASRHESLDIAIFRLRGI